MDSLKNEAFRQLAATFLSKSSNTGGDKFSSRRYPRPAGLSPSGLLDMIRIIYKRTLSLRVTMENILSSMILAEDSSSGSSPSPEVRKEKLPSQGIGSD